MISRLRTASFIFAGVIGAGSVFLVCGTSFWTSPGSGQILAASEPARITVDYPVNGSIFPPEITPPTFLWRDPSANRWVVGVSFADHSRGIRMEAPDERMRIGEI